MNEKEFVGRRKEDWDRLFYLVDRSEAGINQLTGAEIKEFGRLYRRVAGDLAYVRTRSTNVSMLRFLNDLIARGHGVLYRHPRRSWILGFAKLLSEAAAAVRRGRVFIITGILFSVASAFFSANLVSIDRRYLEQLVPPGFQSSLEYWKEGVFDPITAEEGTEGTGFYLVNNTRVSALAAGGGLTFGLLTVYLLFINGAVSGAFIQEISDANTLVHFGAGVLPHGITELLGIFIASGAGLSLGWALINPGRRTRAQSVRKVSKDAFLLMALGIVMIWIAAPIEAWFSHAPQVPHLFKYLFALLSLALWMLYFTFAGRKPVPEEADADS